MAQCNYCSLMYAKERLENEGRKILLKSDGDWIALWSYKESASDAQDSERSFLAITLHCSCGED
jgi:hypothetical protein